MKLLTDLRKELAEQRAYESITASNVTTSVMQGFFYLKLQ